MRRADLLIAQSSNSSIIAIMVRTETPTKRPRQQQITTNSNNCTLWQFPQQLSAVIFHLKRIILHKSISVRIPFATLTLIEKLCLTFALWHARKSKFMFALLRPSAAPIILTLTHWSLRPNCFACTWQLSVSYICFDRQVAQQPILALIPQLNWQLFALHAWQVAFVSPERDFQFMILWKCKPQTRNQQSFGKVKIVRLRNTVPNIYYEPFWERQCIWNYS